MQEAGLGGCSCKFSGLVSSGCGSGGSRKFGEGNAAASHPGRGSLGGGWGGNGFGVCWEELSQEGAGLAQLLEQVRGSARQCEDSSRLERHPEERSERRKAEDAVARDRRADLLRVASLEAQVAQAAGGDWGEGSSADAQMSPDVCSKAAETVESKFHSLRELLDGEKTARSARAPSPSKLRALGSLRCKLRA